MAEAGPRHLCPTAKGRLDLGMRWWLDKLYSERRLPGNLPL